VGSSIDGTSARGSMLRYEAGTPGVETGCRASSSPAFVLVRVAKVFAMSGLVEAFCSVR
jgi:hypothetical protein